MPVVLWFDELCKDDVAVAGGKGANLGELTKAGIPVPPGFVVSVGCYQEFLDRTGLRAQIGEAIAGLDPRNHDALYEVSNAIKRLFEATAVPDDIAQAIRDAYARLEGRPVAVRSSATAEDLAEASFAGQQSTFLNVLGPDRVVEAVRACWASLFETQAIFYRADRGFGQTDVAIAVPVQAMVQSDASGVMFTVNPVTNDQRQIIIEAVWGLGEAAVSGQVTPDMYIIDKETLAVIEHAETEQEQELVGDPDAHGLHAAAWRDVPPERRRAAKLSPEQAGALAQLGMRVEAHYGRPQDIEWALEDGELYILQARPVTTL